MKKAIAFAVIIFSVANSYAQTHNIDSLQQLLKTEKKDTTRVMLLAGLADAYMYSKPDTSLVLAQQALSISKKKGYTKGEAESLTGIGHIFTNLGNYPKALEALLQALKKSESINDKAAIAKITGNLAIVYADQGDNRQALTYTLRSLELGKSLGIQRTIAVALINLGNLYEKLNILDSAKDYTVQAYKLAAQIKLMSGVGISLNNLGNIYSKMGDTAAAMRNYRLSIPYAIENKIDAALCETYLGMAKLFQKAGEADSCLYYAKRSLAIAQNVGFLNNVLSATDFLTGYYTSIHNVDSAFVYQSAAIAAKDSLFSQEKQRQLQSLAFDEANRQQQIQDAKEEARTQMKFNVLFGGLLVLLFVAFLLYRNNRQKQKANLLITQQKEKVESTLSELRSTQKQLIQSEKMASLGELTAGIAHEIQNPLNFVNNFSEVSNELIEEMKAELANGNYQQAIEIAEDIKENGEKINHHGKRADAIVKGMLQHSRQTKGVKEPTDINALADEYLRLSYHGLRAKDKSFNAAMKMDFDENIGKIDVVPQDMGRVLLNLFNNAFYACTERSRSAYTERSRTAVNQQKSRNYISYEPTVSVSTKKIENKVQIEVRDNGNGIPQNVVDKIFQPFFTTKPTGEGTGLGLSLSYDIIKAHGGEIKVESKEDEGTEFVIQIPVNNSL
ncbi:MAG: tetratricopeptide repeat-containing sensor histidine kinase [Flavisolibacter sp.]